MNLIDLFKKPQHWIGTSVRIQGWIRTIRNQKSFSFIELSDGTTQANLQVILMETTPGYAELITQLTTGASVAIKGVVVESPGKNQVLELRAEELEIIGLCPAEEYPLQKKRHSFEFLRTIAHLRPRTNTQGAIARVRNTVAFETHAFFQDRNFLYLHSPIITSSDCEGAGQMFQVTTLKLNSVPKTKEGSIDFSQDFFHKPTFLTVSGQLNGEAYACGLSNIYTFGPTFRAENSHTSRHLAEFWMIEPEVAFATLDDIKELAEAYVKHLIKRVLEKHPDEMDFFDQFIEKGVINRLKHVLENEFAQMTYTEAIDVLEKSGKKFEYPHTWGCDLQSEHERYLAEEYCKKPLILFNYPRKLKAFYMRDNEDGKTVAAMDVLVPKIGEIIGGSQREERFDVLKQKFYDFHLDPEVYSWYLDLRKFGTVPHGGFGLGFERFVQFVTGMENIRDVIAFPRVPGHAEF